jgi:glutathione peroxidase
MAENIYEFSVKDIKGEQKGLETYKGKVLVIVNVASQCGYTPHYVGLQKLQDDYGDKGLVVLGFPCNQFGGQEPGTEADIQNFCSTRYSVTFDLFSKVDVNGSEESPLFGHLKECCPGILNTKPVKWNFTKFLVDKAGHPVKRFAPKDDPESMRDDIEKLLKD